MWLIIAIPVVFVIGMLIAFDSVEWSDGKSFIFPTYMKYRKANKLFTCDHCNRLYRTYQADLYEATHNERRCPHCERYASRYDRTLVKNIQGWMNVHPDCPKLSYVDYLKIKQTIKKIKQHKKDMEQEEYFQNYNKLHADLKWIKNLQGRK